MSSKNSKSSAPSIKGYLPVRLSLPPDESGEPDVTFCYVKEHFSADKATLFVANIPVVPGVSSRVILRSIFGRYGEIDRVAVIENPRTKKEKPEMHGWTTKAAFFPTFRPRVLSGKEKFAHVVFSSSREMKNALKSIRGVMAGKFSKGNDPPGLTLEKLEIQTLMDETERQEKADEHDDGMRPKEPLSGILAVADRYRKSVSGVSRDALLEECNAVMQEFEDAEEADRQAREAAKNQPDEDGFVTVSYSAQSVGSKRELEQGATTTTNRRKGSKRSRKKKEATGASEQKDFYRFQTKESRKKDLQQLRKKFEEDLAKVKKLKEERQYKPF